MKTVIVVALLALGLVLPTSSFAAEKKEGQKLQLLDQSGNNTNMTRRYRTAKTKYRVARYRASQRARTYRTSRVRAYRTQRCDPFMRNVFGICTY